MSNPVYAKCKWGPYPKKGINEGQIIYFQRKDLRPLSNELDKYTILSKYDAWFLKYHL